MKSIAALAEDLGVTPAIIRSWQINLNLKMPKYGNDEPVLNEAWQQFFEQVAHLRKEGQSFSKIRTALATITPSEKTLPEPGSQQNNQAPSSSAPLSPAQIFQPQEIKQNHKHEPAPQVIRSEMSSDDLLGIYGPPSEANQSMTLPALVADPKQNLGALQHLQSNMHEAILQKDLQKMTHTYVQLVENYQALASRYSESTYVIGQLEEKNRALEDKLKQDQALQAEKAQQMEAHVGSLKNMLESQNNRLDQHSSSLVTKDEIDNVEKQIKLLAVTVFKQQQMQQMASQSNGNFWGKLKSLFSRSL
ncbi:MAG: MerR family transcriptional regulator [Candidatus Sericytochromatia bacterium]|nr:MerR family transcriptional regulator [Candidatus Sericytochromatia bacterium]